MAYQSSDDCPHTPVDDPNWQESDCLWFADFEAGLMGFHRLGQHPQIGEAAELLFVARADGTQFKQVRPVAGASRDEATQHLGHSFAKALGGGQMLYGWHDEGCRGELAFNQSFYIPRGWAKDESAEQLNATINSQGHLECSGRIVGEIELNGTRHAVNALAHRDRSWGVRNIAQVVQHRMSSGTMGGELSWAATNLQIATGDIVSQGFVVRDGVEAQAREVEIIAHVGADGVSVCGGLTRLTLESGEVLEIASETKACFGHTYRDTPYFTTENLSVATCQGLQGFCDFETAINPQRGTYVPNQAPNGLHRGASW